MEELTTIPVIELTEAEKRALKPPGTLQPDEWAERHRVLPAKNPLGRRWLNENSPPLRVVMQLAVDPVIRELYLEKAAQIGGSEAFRNVMAANAEQNPLPAMLVLPNEKDGKKIYRKEIRPLFRDCKPLRELRTGRSSDSTSIAIRLTNAFELDLAWSGSPASLASDPKAHVYLDEVDKFEQAANEAPAADLARERMRKFEERAKLLAASTPTTEDGPIHQMVETADILLRYFVPCPHCRHMQVLHQDNLRWKKFDVEPRLRAAHIKAEKAAWFECINCRRAIEDEHKRQIVPDGYFATADQGWRLYPDGRREGTKPVGDRVAVHLPAFYDYQTRWWNIAAAWVTAGNDPEKLKGLYNSTFGEPFKQLVKSVAAGDFDRRCVPDPETGFVPPKAGVVPAWASRLLLVVDTQKDYFVWVVRAWGFGRRSQRIAHGFARNFAELDAIEARPWEYEGNVYPAARIFRTGIDTGGTGDVGIGESRTDEVYQWCRRQPLTRIPLKGTGNTIASGVRWSDITYTPPGGQRDPYSVRLHLFDSELFYELLMGSLDANAPSDDPSQVVPLWSLNDLNDADYNRQMANVHKARVKFKGQMRERWVPKTPGSRHDFPDVEKMQFVLAVGMNLCTDLPTQTELVAQLAAATNPVIQTRPSGIRTPDGRKFFAHRR